MSTDQQLNPDELRRLAERLVAQAYVDPGALAQLGAAYLKLEVDRDARKARDERRGGKPNAPLTEDGRLVARAMAHQLIGKKKYTMSDLAADCNVDRSHLSRCNSATSPVPLSHPIRTTLLWLLGEKTWEDVVAAGAQVVTKDQE